MSLVIASPAVFTLHENKPIILNENDIARNVWLQYIKSSRNEASQWRHWTNLTIHGCDQCDDCHHDQDWRYKNGTMHFTHSDTTVAFKIMCTLMIALISSSTSDVMDMIVDDTFRSTFCDEANRKQVNCVNKFAKITHITPQQPICIHINETEVYYGVHGEHRISLQLFSHGGKYENCMIHTEYSPIYKQKPWITKEEGVIVGLSLVILALTLWIACIAFQLRSKNRRVFTRRKRPRSQQHIQEKSAVINARTSQRPPCLIAPPNSLETSDISDGFNGIKRRNNERVVYNERGTLSMRGASLIRGPCIGSGTFGKIYLTMNLHTRKIFAVKQFHLTSRYNQQSELNQSIEIFTTNFSNLLLKLKCNFGIIRTFGYNINNRKLSIFLPFFTKSSIQQIVAIQPLPLDIVINFGKQIFATMEYLHSDGIIHGGIKGSNVLLSSENEIKLTDTGISQFLQTVCTQQDYYSSLHWSAPEIINGSECKQASDIWSVGMVLVEMLTGKPLWHEIPPIEVMDKIIKLNVSPIQSDAFMNNNVCVDDKQILYVISKCLQPKIYQRLKAKQLLQHEIFDGYCNADFSQIQKAVTQIVQNNEDIVSKFKQQYDMKSPIIKTRFDGMEGLTTNTQHI
eukprot:80327_1